MDVNELKKSGKIIYEVIAGSHAYGLSTSQSDEDIRGIYMNDPKEYLGLSEPPNQINDEKHDIVYYSLKRFFELARTANPNIIELLWMPDEVVKIKSKAMDKIIDNRHLFISKKAFFTHSAYASAQIKKAKGQNKMVHNPMPEERPKKEDFVWIIERRHFDSCRTTKRFPFRPVPLKESGINLDLYHAAGLEHFPNAYRLYFYYDKAKGVFRGDDTLVVESIPYEDEFLKFDGIMIYNEDAYTKAVNEWKRYWEWMKHRNESRWVDQEKGKLNYDQKNMAHCMRLMLSAKNILEKGEPIVRFEGEQLDKLRAIRAGKLEYDDIIAEVYKLEEENKELYEESKIVPHEVDDKAIENLYCDIYSATNAV